MATQKSHLKIQGTIDDVNYYYRDGKYLVRKAPTISLARIRTSEAFQRTRENASEFGGSAKVTGSLRIGFAPFMKTFTDINFSGRSLAEFRKITNLESGVRGKRSVLLSQHREILDSYQFNGKLSFDSVFRAGYTITDAPDRLSSALTIQPFLPVDYLSIPQGATHFRIINAIAVLSDFSYDNPSKGYVPVDETNNELNASTYSDYLPVDTLVAVPLVINTALSGAPVLTADVTVINTIGIEFYQEVNLEYYLFAQNNVMKVAKLF